MELHHNTKINEEINVCTFELNSSTYITLMKQVMLKVDSTEPAMSSSGAQLNESFWNKISPRNLSKINRYFVPLFFNETINWKLQLEKIQNCQNFAEHFTTNESVVDRRNDFCKRLEENSTFRLELKRLQYSSLEQYSEKWLYIIFFFLKKKIKCNLLQHTNFPTIPLSLLAVFKQHFCISQQLQSAVRQKKWVKRNIRDRERFILNKALVLSYDWSRQRQLWQDQILLHHPQLVCTFNSSNWILEKIESIQNIFSRRCSKKIMLQNLHLQIIHCPLLPDISALCSAVLHLLEWVTGANPHFLFGLGCTKSWISGQPWSNVIYLLYWLDSSESCIFLSFLESAPITINSVS